MMTGHESEVVRTILKKIVLWGKDMVPVQNETLKRCVTLKPRMRTTGVSWRCVKTVTFFGTTGYMRHYHCESYKSRASSKVCLLSTKFPCVSLVSCGGGKETQREKFLLKTHMVACHTIIIPSHAHKPFSLTLCTNQFKHNSLKHAILACLGHVV